MKTFFSLFIFLALFCFKAKAQTQKCTPYVLYKDDFGGNAASPNIGTALPAGVTTYRYETSTPVQDGGYGIRKEVRGHTERPNGAWHKMTDHSGDGYMMVVNASYNPGLFYQKTITDLCQGTSFFFSVWVANLMRPSANGPKDPNLKFIILNPGTQEVIGTYTTGLLPRYTHPTWEQYGIEFNLPTGVSSVILQIFNNAEGGNGNDLVLDDITFSICGPPLTTSVTGTYQNGPNTCIGQKIAIQASLPPGTFHHPTYQWQFGRDTTSWQDIAGAETLAYTVSSTSTEDSGWYRIVVAEKGNIQLPNCRIASNPVPVKVWQPQKPDILTNSPVCEGEALFIKIPEALQLECRWTGPGNFTSSQKVVSFKASTPVLSGFYQVKTTNPGGCQSSNTKEITVQQNQLSIAFNKTDSILCEGSKRTLDAHNIDATYLWNTGSTSPNILVDTSGLYKVTVQKGICFRSDSIRLYSLKPPKVNLGPDTSVCYGEPFFLHATYPDVKNYRWDNGSPDSIFVVTQPGTYMVTLSNYCGIAEDKIHIAMKPCSDQLIFPTAFSPNQDGQNDTFRPKMLFALSDYRLRIYNRWGKMIFQSTDPSAGWKGTLQGRTSPAGAYVWIVEYKRIKDDKHIQQQGVITLLR